ncbi:MAG: hypothetical protein DMF69_25170 [Acidobacteria bacterium]|nr:MAG: hypothetical protein DMF69_25170 [Acidobacteriota bacterium]
MFETVEVNTRTRAVRVGLAAAAEFTPEARLRVEQPAKIADVGTYRPKQSLTEERGAYVVKLSSKVTWLELRETK